MIKVIVMMIIVVIVEVSNALGIYWIKWVALFENGQ